jgi:ribosome-binding protein aMBF1 (putative translation factor)
MLLFKINHKVILSQIMIDTTVLTICEIELTAKAPKPKGYPTQPKTYGDYLKQVRLDTGLTQFELALELDVFTSTIDKWERQRIMPNTKSRKKIITFLGYDPMKIKNQTT